jgi:hypothetical protein
VAGSTDFKIVILERGMQEIDDHGRTLHQLAVFIDHPHG